MYLWGYRVNRESSLVPSLPLTFILVLTFLQLFLSEPCP